MLDALRRDRLHPQVRRTQPEKVSGLRRRAHRGAARSQRQDVAHAAQFQRCRDGADGAGGDGLKGRESARGGPSRATGHHRHSTFLTSKALAPLGVTTSTLAPLALPMSARASGEVIEILPFLASASGSPTSCHTCFFSVSSSTKVTVAPNLMVSPDSFDTSITSARASLSSSSAMRPSLCDCDSLAAWYSAFSDRSPCVRASVICWMMRGRSTCWRCLSSFSSVV